MPPTLTLHHGDAKAEYVEHPVEVARRMLIAAAELETDVGWQHRFRRVADALPDRSGVVKRGEA